MTGWLHHFRRLELPWYRLRLSILPQAIRARRVGRWRAPTAAPDAARRTLYVDLAVISHHDAGTGIQRVVRALALALSRRETVGWDIRFVAASWDQAYHSIAWPEPNRPIQPVPMRARPGDVFLGLDYSLDTWRWHRRQLVQFRREGGLLWFLVHDLLPVQRPDWFSPNTVLRYRVWLDLLASLADGFFCNSVQTADDLTVVLRRYGLRPGGDSVRILPMGHDIAESVQENLAHASPHIAKFPELISRAFLLKVGTLEPRKGHIDLIKAFEVLWRRGIDQTLLLVGRLGWRVDDLHAMIVSHPEFGRRLIWLDDVDDAALVEIYDACEGVLVGSLAEGFGLPLVEALGHGKPVLARDLAVFRAHEPSGVRFFPADAAPEVLANHIAEWLDAIRCGAVIVRRPEANWEDSARALMAALDDTSAAAVKPTGYP